MRQLRQNHLPSLRCGRWPLGLAALVLVSLASSVAAADGIGECVDVEAVLGVTVDHVAAQQLARLLPEAHPARSAVCRQLGMDCEHATSEEKSPSCGVEDGLEGSCREDATPEDAMESFAGSLLDEEDKNKNLPHGGSGLACWASPHQCNGLPPLSSPPSFTRVAASDNEPTQVVTSHGWARDVPSPNAAGLGPARGIESEIDRPPTSSLRARR